MNKIKGFIVVFGLFFVTMAEAGFFGMGAGFALHQYENGGKNSLKPVEASATDLTRPGQCPEHYPLGDPKRVDTGYSMSGSANEVDARSYYLCEIGYAVQYDTLTKDPVWSAEVLNGKLLHGAKDPRTNDFAPNPVLDYSKQAGLFDYKNSSYDRGHMTPAADQSGKGEHVMSQSFYLTNMVPQVGENQNRGIWEEIEKQVRFWAMDRNQVYVVTGPVFNKQEHSVVGRDRVWVPQYLFKVVYDPARNESIGFLVPNVQVVSKSTKRIVPGIESQPQTLASSAINCNGTPCIPKDFAVPVAEIEKYAGLRFFPALSDDQHNNVTIINFNSWKFSRH
jgi:endonuclease G